MPKQTFFNLSEEKKARLLKAAHQEFSQYGFSESSINRIIKLAQIPRGSFYQYFEDKQDLYFYFASGMKDRLQVSFFKSLAAHQGDLFATIKANIKEMQVNLANQDYTDFFRILIESRDYRLLLREMHLKRNQQPKKQTESDFWQQLYQATDLKNLRVSNYEEFRTLMSLVMTALIHSLELAYAMTDQKGKVDGQFVAKKFYWTLELIEHGALYDGRKDECSS